MNQRPISRMFLPWLGALLIALLLRPGLPGRAGQEASPPPGAPGADLNVIEVRVLPFSEVPGNTFTLGEVAELDGFDLKAVRLLAAASLGPSPRPGQALRLNEPLLRSRLARVVDPERIRLLVPQQAQVVRQAQVIPGTEIARKVMKQAARQSQASPANLEQKLLSPVPDVVLPEGEVAWDIEQRGRNLAPGGSRTFRVTARVDGKEAWRGLVRMTQSVYRPVVVASRAIRRNHVLTGADVRTERLDVSRMKTETYLSKTDQVVGKRALRPIGQGEWVHAGILEAPADIPEGGRVTVVYQTPLLLFQVPGVAMTPGKVGDFIPVRNLQSGKIVYGVVQADDTVKVN